MNIRPSAAKRALPAGYGTCYPVSVNMVKKAVRKDRAEAGIRLVPVGGIDAVIVSAVAEEVGVLLGFPVTLAPARSPGIPLNNPRSNQYSSVELLESLRNSEKGQGLTLAITDLDLSYPGLNYVFGLADDKCGAAVISIARFVRAHKTTQAASVVSERTVKTAVHELGHLMGLPHCKVRKCVMFFSHNLSDTDYKEKTFCDKCGSRVGLPAGPARRDQDCPKL